MWEQGQNKPRKINMYGYEFFLIKKFANHMKR